MTFRMAQCSTPCDISDPFSFVWCHSGTGSLFVLNAFRHLKYYCIRNPNFLHLFKIERPLALHQRMQRHDTDKRFGFAHMTALTIVSKQSTKESLSTSLSAHSSTTLLSMRIVSES